MWADGRVNPFLVASGYMQCRGYIEHSIGDSDVSGRSILRRTVDTVAFERDSDSGISENCSTDDCCAHLCWFFMVEVTTRMVELFKRSCLLTSDFEYSSRTRSISQRLVCILLSSSF